MARLRHEGHVLLDPMAGELVAWETAATADGFSGTCIIRDSGGVVEFHFDAYRPTEDPEEALAYSDAWEKFNRLLAELAKFRDALATAANESIQKHSVRG